MTASARTSEESDVTSRGVVARYFRIWNDGDPSLVAELLADGFVDHAHPERTCAQDVVDAILATRAQQPDLRVYVDALLGDGGLVTVNGRIQTTAETRNWVWIVRVEDRLMKEMWTYSAD